MMAPANFMDPRLPDRFWDKCIPEPNSGCWLWIGGTSRGGYGAYWHNNRLTRAPRTAYAVLVGDIPPRLVIDHQRCSTPACCNPAHLKPVTNRQNVKRGPRCNKTHCPRGHEYTRSNTRIKTGVRAGGKVCRACHRDDERARLMAGKKARS